MVKNNYLDHDHNAILSSIGHGQMVKIDRYFNNFNKFQQQNIWNCRDGRDHIWIDHFDQRTLIWPNGQKIVVIDPPPP